MKAPRRQEATLKGRRTACILLGVPGAWTAYRAARAGRAIRLAAAPDAAAAVAAADRSGTPVVAALGVRDAMARWIDAPFASRRKARRVYATLLDIQLPFPLEECVTSLAGEDRAPDGRCRALAVGSRRERLEARRQALAGLGADPWVVDHEGLALWSQAGRDLPPAGPEAWRAVAWLDDGVTLVLGRGATFYSAHRLAEDDPSAVRRLLAAAGAESPPAGLEWIWVGPAAGNTSRRAALRGDTAGRDSSPPEPEQFLARALAERALLPGPWRCNLRAGSAAHPALARRERRRLLAAPAAAAAAGLILLGAAAAGHTVLARRQAQAEDRLAALVDTLAGYHVAARGEHARAIVQDAVAARRLALAPFTQAGGDSRRAPLFALLRAAGSADAVLERIELAEGQLLVRGSTAAPAGAETLRAVLAASYPDCSLEVAPRRADGRYPFTLKAEDA